MGAGTAGKQRTQEATRVRGRAAWGGQGTAPSRREHPQLLFRVTGKEAKGRGREKMGLRIPVEARRDSLLPTSPIGNRNQHVPCAQLPFPSCADVVLREDQAPSQTNEGLRGWQLAWAHKALCFRWTDFRRFL